MTQQLKQDKVEFYVNALETMGYSHPNDIPGKWWSGRSGQAEKEEACRLVYTTLPDRRKKKPSTVADNQTTGQVKDDLKAMLIEFKRESDDKFNKLAEMMQTGKAPGISTSEKQAKAEKQLVPTDTLEIKTVTVKQTKCVRLTRYGHNADGHLVQKGSQVHISENVARLLVTTEGALKQLKQLIRSIA